MNRVSSLIWMRRKINVLDINKHDGAAKTYDQNSAAEKLAEKLRSSKSEKRYERHSSRICASS